MASQSSNGTPFESFSEYRLLTTFLALIPSCCDLRRGETAGDPTLLFPIFLPTTALIISAFLTGSPKVESHFKNGYARRIATQAINLECGLDTPVGSVRSANAWLESNTGAWPLHQLLASYQAEWNILLSALSVNILWLYFFVAL
jgi:hypothetical protein